MKEHSRVWVYPGSRDLSAEECANVDMKCRAFVENWTAHSTQLLGSSHVLFNRFVVLSVDELSRQASGCSIDSSVNFVRSLESETGISFLNGGKVAVKVGSSIELLSTREVRQLSEKGAIDETTTMYDHLVPDIGALEERFVTTVGNSWLKRFLNKTEKV